MAHRFLLAIETSSQRGSVALVQEGRLLAVRHLSAERRHASELIPTMAALLEERGRRIADVTLFCFSGGPGSFTGLRIAATVGRMLQSASGCRVVRVCTLETIAQRALHHPDRPSRFVVMLDAKRGQVYGALFERKDDDTLGTVEPAGLHHPQPWLATIPKPFWILGEGLRRHEKVARAAGASLLKASYWSPSAEHVALIGQRLAQAGCYCEPEEIVPVYLRPPEAQEVYEKRRAEARQRWAAREK